MQVIPMPTRTGPPGYQEYPGGLPFDYLYCGPYMSAT